MQVGLIEQAVLHDYLFHTIYLIIGKVVNPSEAGLEGKVGEGEALVEVSKGLIDEI